jgi:hydroxypyruvate isomerase
MTDMSRRNALLGTGVAAFSSLLVSQVGSGGVGTIGRVVTKGRLKQSVSRWPFEKIPFKDFCRAVAEMGLKGIDLLEMKDWDTVRQCGLVCSMGYVGAGTISEGLNVKANHDSIVKSMEKGIPSAAKAGVPNVITFFGNRHGMSDAEALENCVSGLNRVKNVAEGHGVTVCVELLNSKIDHKDYQGDRTSFGVEVVKAVGSPQVKLLYDIYHMQIMEGDIIRTIRENAQWIGHYHTGGNPGRHEIDSFQELNYSAICAAIVATGFNGFVAHEFIPTRDPLTSLREAAAICDV